jgi:hypothetical protein
VVKNPLELLELKSSTVDILIDTIVFQGGGDGYRNMYEIPQGAHLNQGD